MAGSEAAKTGTFGELAGLFADLFRSLRVMVEENLERPAPSVALVRARKERLAAAANGLERGIARLEALAQATDSAGPRPIQPQAVTNLQAQVIALQARIQNLERALPALDEELDDLNRGTFPGPAAEETE